MANIQYVGARYVPTFANPVEWSKVRSYEALTMVQHLGGTFTSRQPVPAGVDIDNTEYWVNTGNYNAQVEQYRQETAELSAQYAGIVTDINTLKVNVNTSLKTCVAIGDSYARGTGGTVGRGIFYYLEPFFKTFIGRANGGAGYATVGNTDSGDFNGKTFVEALADVIASMSDDEKNNVSCVVCTGGLNDAAVAKATLATAVVNFVTMAKSAFKNANVYCFTPWCDGGFTAAKYYNAMCVVEENASDNGAVVSPDLKFRFIGATQYGAGDNIHLNEDGYKVLASVYANLIAGGSDMRNVWMGRDDTAGDESVTASYRDIRVGAMCYLTGTFKATYNAKDNPVFVTLAPYFRPQSTFYVPCVAYGAETQVVVAEVSATGRMRLMPTYARKLTGEYTIYINHSWMVGV